MKTRARAPGRAPQRGFTLVEVIVALSLMSLIALGLASAMGTLGNTASALDRRGDRANERRLVGNFLHFILSQPVRHILYRDAASERVYYRGDPHELQWLGNMPARHGLGGLHHLRLTLVAAEHDRTALLLQYTPFIGADHLPDWDQAPAHVLLREVDHFSIAYESRPSPTAGEARWQAQWADPENVPGRVRVDLSSAGQPWPSLWITLYDAGGGAGGAAASIVTGAGG